MEALSAFTLIDPNRNVFNMQLKLESSATHGWVKHLYLLKDNYTNTQHTSVSISSNLRHRDAAMYEYFIHEYVSAFSRVYNCKILQLIVIRHKIATYNSKICLTFVIYSNTNFNRNNIE